MSKTKYTYKLIWSDEDDGYIGLCEKYPSLSWIAENPTKALRGIITLVKKIDEEIQKQNNGEIIGEKRKRKGNRHQDIDN